MVRHFAPILVASLIAFAAAVFVLQVPVVSAQSSASTACIAHRPQNYDTFYASYTPGCSGHDEPELDPVSSLPGSARDLTWTAILPMDGSVEVATVGPAFWFGGTVTDPHSLFGQAFVELQFYPDAIVTACNSNGGFRVLHSSNSYSACSPVWRVVTNSKGKQIENAAFNAMLTDGTGPDNPLVMHAGDTITVHWFTTSANDGFHVTVTDLSTGGSGTIVLNSKQDGPLMPAFNRQEIGKALGWGIVDDTPNSFVWEIGHTSDFSHPAGEFCLPGQKECFSYDNSAWAGITPIKILSVTFHDGSAAKEWAVVSDFGGKAEIKANCDGYGGPFCIYPWFTEGTTGLHYGVDYSDTVNNFGKASQFFQTTMCGGPFGHDSTYCDNVIIQ